MQKKPKIGISMLTAGLFLTIFCWGVWIWLWIAEWPPSYLQVMVTLASAGLGLIACIDRVRNWDVREWQWRDSRRHRAYAPFLYRLAYFGGVLGMLSVPILDRFISQDTKYALLSGIGVCMGLVFGWGTIEGCRHLWYHRAKR